MLPRSLLSIKKFEVIMCIVIILLLIAFSLSDTLQHTFYNAVLWGEHLLRVQPLLGAVFFFFFSLLSAMLAFASSSLLIPSAILTWGTPVTFILLLSGWITGAVCAYCIGSRLARPALASLISEEKVRYYECLVSRNASFLIVLLFCLAAPSEISGYLLGTIRSRFSTFILAATLAESIYALGTVFAVQGILENNMLFTGRIIILSAILVVAASLVLLYTAKKKNHTHR